MAMNEKQVHVEAILALLDDDEVTSYIDADVLAGIKKYDSHPVFAMMTIGCEGESSGALHNGDSMQKISKEKWYKQLWPLKAVKNLVSKLSEKQVPIYANVHDVENKLNRKPVGRLVAATKKVVGNLTHAMGVAYITDIPTRTQLQSGELNACSMEAKCFFSKAQNAVNWIVEQVTDVMGVVLFNRNIVQPGVNEASIHAVVTAMSAEDDKGQEMEITLEQVRQYIEKNGVTPSKLFSVETLTRDPKVADVIKNDISVAVTEKEKKITELNDELTPLKRQLSQGKIGDFIETSELLKDESKQLVAYLKKITKVEGDVDQASVDKELKIQLDLVKSAGVKFDTNAQTKDKPGEEGKPKAGEKPNEDDTTVPTKLEDFTNPKNNPLIPATQTT